MTQFAEYQAHGWKLCGIPAGAKGPTYLGWNDAPATDPSPGAGLLHSLSGTCAIDVDNLQVARPFLAAVGVDIDALLAAPDSVQIVSGRANRAKLLYALSNPLPSRKLCEYESLVDGKKYHALELRCGSRNGKSVQDVLPPSIHPGTGQPYTWKFGHPLIGDWRQLPPLPAELLALWSPGVEVHKVEPVEMDWDHPQMGAMAHELATGAAIAELRGYLDYHDPDGSYEDWVAVGMALHDSTGGGPEGLALWDEWSRKGAKYGLSEGGRPPQYPVEKWGSFTAGSGYTVGYLRSKAPAALESFPIAVESEFTAMPDAALDTRPGALVRRALEPLVFVSSQGLYYDTVDRGYLSMQSVDHLYTPKMPTMLVAGSNGASKSYQPKPTEELRRASWKEVVHGVALNPGGERVFEEDGRRFLNSWEPQNITPLKPTAGELEAFNFMWSRPDEKIFRDWLLQFFAHAVQKPGIKIGMAPLIVGHNTGSGKNTLAEVLPRLLFGSRHFNTMTYATLKSDFSDKIGDTWWLYFSELHSGSTKSERVSIIKKVEPWVTDRFIEVHPKGGKPYDIRNRVQPIASSNFEEDAIYVNDTDRRWCVGHIESSLTDAEASGIYSFLDSPRAAGVLQHIFREVSLTGFNPKGRAPSTAAKRIMVSVNYGTAESELLEMIGSATPPFDKDLINPSDLLPYVKRSGVTGNRLARILKHKPFKFVDLPPSYGKRLLAWRNADAWLSVGPAARRDYHQGVSGRPVGPTWTDELPPALAEACGLG